MAGVRLKICHAATRWALRQPSQYAPWAQVRGALSHALLWGACIVVGAGLSLSACAGQPTATTARTPISSPTEQTPRTLYTADWSHGPDGWRLPPDWSVRNGQLVNDGRGVDPIPIPYHLTEPRYTIEMQVRIQDYTCTGDCNAYGLAAQGANGARLYVAQIDAIAMDPPHHGFALLMTPYPQDPRYQLATQDFVAGSNMRSYTVSVDGDTASYAISGTRLGSVTASLPFSPTTLSISDEHVRLVVSSLTITAP